MKITQTVRKHSIALYFIFSFLISWGFVIFLAGFHNIPINAEEITDLLPLLYVSMLLGPGISGLIFTAVTDGAAGIKSLFSGLVRVRVNLRWYILAILPAPLLAIAILGTLSTFSPEYYIGFLRSDDAFSFIFSALMAGIFVGIFEEIGWTGFVLKNTLNQQNIFKMGLLVGVLWGAWHFILFWESQSFSGTIPVLILAGRLITWLVPYRIFMARLFYKTKSLLLTVLAHVSLVFTVTAIVPMTLQGTDLLIWLGCWSGVLWLFVWILSLSSPTKQEEPAVKI